MMLVRNQQNQSALKSHMINWILNYFDKRAAFIFIVAHFLSVGVYDLLVVGDEFAIPKGGFILHMLQAAVFASLLSLKLKFELSLTAGIISIWYFLMAVNWAFLESSGETHIQAYFYNVFPSIIMTMNLIVIYLLGKDGAIHMVNTIFKRYTFLSRIRLFL
jgi:hypothetical protein